MMAKADTITMQVIRYGLEAVADDMGYNLVRMGRTTIVKEIMDINCGVLDAGPGTSVPVDDVQPSDHRCYYVEAHS